MVITFGEMKVQSLSALTLAQETAPVRLVGCGYGPGWAVSDDARNWAFCDTFESARRQVRPQTPMATPPANALSRHFPMGGLRAGAGQHAARRIARS